SGYSHESAGFFAQIFLTDLHATSTALDHVFFWILDGLVSKCEVGCLIVSIVQGLFTRLNIAGHLTVQDMALRFCGFAPINDMESKLSSGTEISFVRTS